MVTRLIWIVILVTAVVGVGFASPWLNDKFREQFATHWKTAKVQRGRIVNNVNSTGTVKPVLSVAIGSFVSGPVLSLRVDFNDNVKAGDVLAIIDPRLFAANVARDQAILASRQAELERVQSQLQLAKLNERRGVTLRQDKRDFLSQAEMDALAFEVKSLEAQLKLAAAAIDQAKATLDNSVANLEYTEIKAPVDGTVIDKKVEPGQTIAAQFQTPELFTIAPDLRKKIHVFASVDESDIGFIQRAQKENRRVTFTVDAHSNELFEGHIEQIRVSSASVQSVVTYPVVIAAANEELKLLPGMTASISFEIDVRDDCMKIPSAAIRFFPTPEQVEAKDRHLVDGSAFDGRSPGASNAESGQEALLSADEHVEAHKRRIKRHVWVAHGNFVRAIEVTTGIEENRYVEMVDGDLFEGMELVTGVAPKL